MRCYFVAALSPPSPLHTAPDSQAAKGIIATGVAPIATPCCD